MKKWIKEEQLSRIFCVLAIGLFGVLFYYSFGMTWENQWDLAVEYVYPKPDSLFQNTLCLTVILLAGWFFYQLEKRNRLKINMDIVAAIISVLACVFSIYWIGASGAVPQADQLIACEQAEAFESGNWEGLHKGMYVGIYQHQLGLITFLRLLYKIFGNQNYLVYQYLNAFMVAVFLFSGYQVTKKISGDNRLTEAFYLIMMAGCLPLYCYVPFVYGEITSTALVMLAAWMFLWSLEKFSLWKMLIMTIALGGAVQLRRNTLIFMIAFLIVALIQLLRGINKQGIIRVISVFLGVVLLQAYINGMYAKMIPEDSFSAPTSVFIAMGVNDDNGIPGWHNYYDQLAFQENDYNIEKTNAAAWEYLRNFFETNKDNPKYIVDFFYRKVNSQWNAPMYQCLAMNNKIEGEQSGLARSLYFGGLREVAEDGMNIYQLVIYGGVLAALLVMRSKWNKIEHYLLLIGVYGGFLFSIIWEAKTRYVFPYFLVMIPYGALGVYEVIKKLDEKRKNGKTVGKDERL